MSSILILGNGKTNKYLNQIELFTYSHAKTLFSGSKLLTAYEMCIPVFDQVYLANIKSPLDYIEVSKTIDEQKFDYICPIELYASDTVLLNQKKVPIVAVMLDIIRPHNALFVLSDLHASAFLSAEQFTSHYNSIAYNLQRIIKDTDYSQNVIMVANQFIKHELGQIAFAIDDLNSPCNVYIDCTFGNSYFDLDIQDICTPVIFIKNNTLINPTYENLVNFSNSMPEKFILVNKIVRYVNKQLEFNWSGKRFIRNIFIAQLKSLLVSRLDNIKGFCIDDYSIDRIEVIKKPAYYDVFVYISIVPILYTEGYSFMIEKRI